MATFAGTSADDFMTLTANGFDYRGGQGNDTYLISPNTLPTTPGVISIIDTEGTNRIQLADGLSITSSSFLANAVELLLSNGSKIRILGAVNFVYDVGANATSGDVAEHPNASYSEFAAALGASVPAPGAPAVVGPPVVIGPGPVSSYTLASSTDVAIEGSTVTFTVTRTDTTAEKTLTFNTVGDTNGGTVNAATPGTDSTPASGAVTFAAGAATATFTINVTADLVSEGLEGLKVSLFDGLTSITSKTVLINEDPITYNLTASPSNVNEGATVTFTLATTGVADGTVLPYTLSGTGITTDDVTGGLTGTATVLSNKATITVPVVADFTTEGDESLTLALDSGKASVSALIKDTSTTPVFTVAAGAASVDEAANATFNLTADNAAFNGTVDYTLSGTGITADDVVPASLTGKATFVNGVSSVTVALADDSTTEGTETMTLTLGGKSDSIAVKDISVTPAMGDDTVAGTIVAGQGTAIFTPAEVTAFRNNDLTNRGVSSTGTVNIDFGSGQGGQVVELKNGNTMFVADSGVRVGSFKYSVSDIAGLQGTVNVTLDTAPTIDPIADQAILEGASTKITPVVADADGDALTTTATDGKYGTVVDNKDGTFTYTHTDTNTAGTDLKAGEVVNDTFVLTTTDPYGLSASTTVKVAVTGTEDPPPPYTLTAASTSVNEGASATFNLVSTGVAAGTLVPYTLTGVSAADVTGGLTGKATIGADGKATITVPVVADATTENVTETLTVTLDGTTVSASTIVNDTSVGPEASYYLLKTQDIATANKFFGSQTYFNVDGVGPTLNTGDFLTGTAGRIDNTLTVTDLTPGVANGNIPAGVTLLNIQNVILNSSNNTSAGTGFSTVGYADVRNLTVTTNGDLPDLIAAKNGTDGTVVTATHNGFAVAGNMTVVGGTDVTTTSVGGNIVVGSPAQARVPLSTEVATGAIVVNQNSTSTGLVGVFGGTTVNVTTSSTSNTGTINVGNTPANTGNTSSGILANPSGNINVKTSGTGVVTVFGGQDIVVTDSALKGAGAITVGDVTRVDSDNQPAGTVTINEAAQIAYNGLAGSSNNNTASGTIGVFGGTNVSVTTNAANAVNIGNLGAVKENSLNPTGTISVTNTGVVNSAAGVAATAAAIAGATPASVAAAMAGTAFATVANTAAAAGGATAASVSAAVAAATPPVEGAVLITGGTDVTVSTTGANVTIGRAANAVVDQVSNPTGNVSVTETMNGNGAARTVTVDGGAAVTVNAKGQNVNIGTAVNSAPTGAVTVTQSDMLTGNGAYLAGTNAGNVTVDGGTSVTVNTTGGNVVVGAVVGGVNTVPSGAVGITRTFSGPGQDTTAVLGGTTVDITTTKTRGGINIGTASDTLNAAGSALKDAALAPTGNVNIVNATTVGSTTAYGTSVSQIRTNGAQTVSVKGADVDAIIDIQSTLATGGSNAGKAVGVSALKNVVMEGLAFNDGFVLRSDALESLSVLNTQGGANTITITNNTAAHPLSITQGGNSAALWVNGAPINNAVSVVDAKATSVTVTDNGTASTAVLAVQAVKATDLTVNNTAAATVNLNLDAELKNITLKGTGAVTLQNVGTLGKIASIDALASSGAVTTDLTVTSTAGVSQKFTGGTGKATLTVSSNAFSYGNQVLLTGGSGSTDVIVANYVAAGTDLAMGNTAAVKGFEFLGLGTLANGTYDATGFTGVTLGAVAGAPTLTNMAKDASLSITAAPGFATTLTPSAATLGTTDGLTINLNTNTVNAITGETVGINANTVTANGYETLSIVSNGAGGNKQILANTMTLVDTGTAGTGTLAISGTGKLTLTDASTRFSSIAVTNSTAVDLDAVVVSNKGAAISGGAGSLKATGATGGTEVVVVSLGATAGSATPFAIADTAEVVIDGTTFTYTVAGAAASTATVATGLAALINAGATGVVATASGGNVVLTKAALFSATVFQSVNTGTGTVAASLVGGAEEATITLSGVGAAFAAGDTVRVVLNGVNVTSAAAGAGGETAAQMAARLVTAINAVAANAAAVDAKDGLFSAVANGANVVITGGGTLGVVQIGAVSQPVNTGTGGIAINAPAINYATANDSFTSGSGGGTYTVGLGGSWSDTVHRYSSGSETVNLAASTATVDTLKLADGRVVTNNGTTGGVTSFTVGNLLLSDSLNFATAGKTPVSNVTVAAAVSAVTGAATMANVLDPSGALLTALGNLTYTISNGVITFSATGGHSLSEFTTAQLISAAELLVNSTSTGGANKVAVFSTAGNSYVVASDAAATLAAGANAKDILVQLSGVASSTGFGSTGAQGAVVSDTVTNVTSNAVNSGSAAVAVYNQAGFSADTIVAAELGSVSTSITNLAPSAKLTLTGAASNEAVSITQTGTAGLNSLTLDVTAGPLYKSITTTGDGLLVLTPSAATTINSLVDGGSTNTLATIKVVGGGAALDVKAITDTALTTIDSSLATAAVTLGSTTAIANSGVTFKLAVGQASTITATGAGDVFTQGVPGSLLAADSGAGVVTLTASGSANTITLSNGANVITASGANDVISVGTGSNIITATGASDTINVASGAGTTAVTVGTLATVNIGTVNTANAGAETVVVTAAVTGGTTDTYAKTTVNFASGSTITGNMVSFAGTVDAFSMLGDSTPGTNATAVEVAASQINVAAASSLADALNMAANYTLLKQAQGSTAASANLAANTGVIDWFQYGGDTYLVAMVNSTAAAVQQTGLDANDIVVKIAGLVDLSSASTFTQATELFTI